MALFNENNIGEYLTTIGYKQTEVKSQKKYYVNKKGNQVRVGKGITLLDNRGFEVSYYDNEIKSSDLEEFSKL